MSAGRTRKPRTANGSSHRRVAGAGVGHEPQRLLVELGFTQNESRVYLALLDATGATATAADAATAAGVPRPKVYEALAALESRGFCRGEGGRVSRYSAVGPDPALDNWVRHRDSERATLAERDRDHAETLARLLPKPPATSPGAARELMESISGRIPTTETLESLVGRARTSLVEMLQPPFLQPRPRWNVMETEALARGVDVRVVYTPDAIEDPRRYLMLVEHGCEVRVADQLPMKLLVRDDEEALISLTDATTGVQSLTSAIVRHPDLVAPLRTLFDEVWSGANRLQG